jgi:hypothetical protein
MRQLDVAWTRAASIPGVFTETAMPWVLRKPLDGYHIVLQPSGEPRLEPQYGLR